MNVWTVLSNPTSQECGRLFWLWLHIQEQHCLNNTSHKAAFPLSSLPPQAMPTKSVHVASWCTWSHKWSAQKNSLEFYFRLLFSPPRSAPWYTSPHSCINSWLWQSTGRGVGWAPMSKEEGEPGLFKLSLPSEKCSKKYSPSCMKCKSTGLDCQLLSVCMKNFYKIGKPLHTKYEDHPDLFLLRGLFSVCYCCEPRWLWLFNVIMLLDTIWN